jgi:TonB family protein
VRQSVLVLLMLLPFGPLTATAGDLPAGTFSGKRYENNQHRFSIDIPDGWQAGSAEVVARVRQSRPGVILVIEPETQSQLVGTMVFLEIEEAGGFSGTGTGVDLGKQYVESASRAPDVDVARKPIRVLVGGREFYRIDLTKKMRGEQDTWFALLALGSENSVLVFKAQAASQKAVDSAVGMLVHAVQFVPDWSVPDSQLDRSKYRVRISMGAAEELLTTKVQPIYPAGARGTGVQGYVLLGVMISSQGEVQRLWIAEGNPSLAAAAIDAVRQWRYKPYILDGKPVTVYTKVSVNFVLR